MKSHFEEIEIKRQWSILPVRALLDEKLLTSELRVLLSLCVFTNSHGVCWPGVKTIGAMLKMDPGTVSRNVRKLIKKGYVRKLDPKDYQLEYAKFGKINRYQVLYEPDAPVPTWEEVQTSLILAPIEDVKDAPINDMGSGDCNALQSLSHALAHSYAAAITRTTGQTRIIDNEINHARRLAEKGATVEQVTMATEALARQWLAERRGVPSLYDVAGSLVP